MATLCTNDPTLNEGYLTTHDPTTCGQSISGGKPKKKKWNLVYFDEEKWLLEKTKEIISTGVRKNTMAPISRKNPRVPVSRKRAKRIAEALLKRKTVY
jgi:hypothetical protein